MVDAGWWMRSRANCNRGTALDRSSLAINRSWTVAAAASSFAPRDATPEASTKRGVTRDHQSMTEAEVVIDSSGGEAMTTPSGPKLVLYSEQRAALSGAVDA